MRALASFNLIGLGLGPLFVGIVSDIFADSFGARSLSIGLTLLAGFSVWGGFHFMAGARYLRADLMRPNTES